MPLLQSKLFSVAEIKAGIAKVTKKLSKTVVCITYVIGEDWTGDSSIFFRIVLRDEATVEKKLLIAANHVREALNDEIDPMGMGLHSYCNYRSESEQKKIGDKGW